MPAINHGPDALQFSLSGTEIRESAHVGTVAGVAITFIAGLVAAGVGILSYNAADGTLQWMAPGSATFGPRVDVSAGGDFLVEDGDDPDQYLLVAVTAAKLPATQAQARIYIAGIWDNGAAGDGVTAAEAAAGAVATYNITVTNVSAANVNRILVWLDNSFSADVTWEISNDGATWASPTTEATAISLADLVPAGTATLYLRRTAAAGSGPDPALYNLIHHSFSAQL